jgi:hypothetical protein
VIAQLAISMVLLVGATLFIGTLVKLYNIDTGIKTSVFWSSVSDREKSMTSLGAGPFKRLCSIG